MYNVDIFPAIFISIFGTRMEISLPMYLLVPYCRSGMQIFMLNQTSENVLIIKLKWIVL